MDSTGNLIWLKKFTAGYRSSFFSFCESHNTGYAAAGYLFNSFYDTGYGIVNRVDDSGELVWQKKYRLFGFYINMMTIKKISEGYLLTGVVYDNTIGIRTRGRTCLIRTDTSGNTLFTKVFAEDSSKTIYWIRDLEVINPNRYIITYPISDTGISPDSLNAKIIIVDSLGNVLNSKVFAGADYTYFNRCYVIGENDYLLVGNSDLNVLQSLRDIYIIRTDSMLNFPPNFIGVKKIESKVPLNFKLYQNFPNPFNPLTKIKFQISEFSDVKLIIYDVIGSEIDVLVKQTLKPGTYEVEWDGSKYSSGVYFYKLATPEYFVTKKMVLIK